jgi:hypothetical protein
MPVTAMGYCQGRRCVVAPFPSEVEAPLGKSPIAMRRGAVPYSGGAPHRAPATTSVTQKPITNIILMYDVREAGGWASPCRGGGPDANGAASPWKDCFRRWKWRHPRAAEMDEGPMGIEAAKRQVLAPKSLKSRERCQNCTGAGAEGGGGVGPDADRLLSSLRGPDVPKLPAPDLIRR